jgi:chromosome partitioning protein
VNSKGGVGKSTIAVHYAVAEREKGRRVALIDSDVQESSTRWLKELADGIRVYRLPTPDDVLEEAPKLKEQYDLVIADGPGGLSEVTRAILLRADVALLPCGPFTLDLRPAKDSMRVLKPARSFGMSSLGPFLYLTNYKPTPGSRASSYRPQTPSVCRSYPGCTFDKRMPMGQICAGSSDLP